MKKACRRALALIAACLSMSALGSTATAAALTSISWSITGGTFFASGVLGKTAPITGGSVVWTPLSAVSTPTIMPLESPFPGSLQLTLQTADTSVALTFRSLIGTITDLYAVIGGPFPTPGDGAFASVNYFGVYRRAYVSFLNGTTIDDYHVATLGQEVRTLVPEASSAALVGLGLLVLALTAGAEARERKSRTRPFIEPQARRFPVDHCGVKACSNAPAPAVPAAARSIVDAQCESGGAEAI